MAPLGVGMRCLSVTSLPVVTSTSAPLIPEPPISTPSTIDAVAEGHVVARGACCRVGRDRLWPIRRVRAAPRAVRLVWVRNGRLEVRRVVSWLVARQRRRVVAGDARPAWSVGLSRRVEVMETGTRVCMSCARERAWRRAWRELLYCTVSMFAPPRARGVGMGAAEVRTFSSDMVKVRRSDWLQRHPGSKPSTCRCGNEAERFVGVPR